MKVTYEQLKAAQQTLENAQSLYAKVKNCYVEKCEHLEIGVPYYDQQYCIVCGKEESAYFWGSLPPDSRRKRVSAA